MLTPRALPQAALELRPNPDEARAAHYNSACCLTRLGRFEEAADSVITAVNDYDLKFIVALKVGMAAAFPLPLLCSPNSPISP